ncbi:F-box protein interaction domain protein [Senna tora]|uniref:F-box protein interaction domain protein n=1 Tax=Senna tora TaxID=362788 RepID=A0A834TSR4_9FABA|nr:F-box protein interaction domain protein [Senna tora]
MYRPQSRYNCRGRFNRNLCCYCFSSIVALLGIALLAAIFGAALYVLIAMKRKSDSIATHRWKGKREEEEVDEPEIQPLWPSFADLPSPITTNILLRLPIKSILLCKCVCKTWHAIISDPHFAELHFKHEPTGVMIRNIDPNRVSRNLHLLEFQPENFMGCLDYDNRDPSCICDDFCEPICKRHKKFGATFKLPLRDAKMVLDKKLEAKKDGRKMSYIPCKPKDDKFDVVNSCKGLLCLCDPMDGNPLVVCNPITGEFIRLPKACKIFRGVFDCGFGYHEKTREFKVIRVYNKYAQDPKNAKRWLCNGRVAEMHTLGSTGTWKSVGIGTVPSMLRFPTSFNGALHWVCPFPSGSEGLIIYGVRDSWIKICNISMLTDKRWPYLSYQPIKLFDKGAAILMYNSCNCLIYHELRGHGFSSFRVCGPQYKIEAFAHIPSLISLKDAVKGDVEVQNVHSRCAAFKLREDNDFLCLAEENVDVASLYSSLSEDL